MRGMLLRSASVIVLAGAVASCESPRPISSQEGYRGTAMVDVQNPRTLASKEAQNTVPQPLPASPPGGPLASTVFRNVQVLGGISVPEMTRLMLAMTSWVAPDEGCNYCHVADLSSDEKYTKVVARRMLQMTQHVNSTWKNHVAETGVTCYTCHRGNPVPSEIWFDQPNGSNGFAGNKAGQNTPASSSGLSSLPYDPFSAFLLGADNIRTVSTTALPSGDRMSIKQTEWTYALMVNISESLGVNCTYCHNSRSFTDWDQSRPQRATAYYGIRMVRDINNAFLAPLADVLPPARHGPLGDGPKVACATCHKGVFKPLYGAHMLADYQELAAPTPAADAAPAAPEAPSATSQAGSP